MNSSEDSNSYDELLQKALEGQLSESETVELRQLLKDQPDALDRYMEHCQMESWLSDPDLYTNSEIDETIIDFDPKQQPSTFSTRFLIPALATAAAVMLILLVLGKNEPTAQDRGVARVLRVEGSNSLENGSSLGPDTEVKMKSGLIELAFRDSGVHLLGTAPLHFTTDSTMRIFLHEGEVKLVVPPQGIGFEVETDDRKITDLGTSFVVSARPGDDRVIVLDGQIKISAPNKGPDQYMNEGDAATFNKAGQMHRQSQQSSGVPERAFNTGSISSQSLQGQIFGFPADHTNISGPPTDAIGNHLLPLVKSNFTDLAILKDLKQGNKISFDGIAGTYDQFPKLAGLSPYQEKMGWLAWYQGKVVPPQSGKYRFWGYADNHLVVSINGKPVFEGGRYDSAFRKGLKTNRTNHPSFPCLNSAAGFAAGTWFEASADEPVNLDILFGEIYLNRTSGILLIERQGEDYEETFWGQPKWPLFLTESPNDVAALNILQTHMEKKLKGSFSIPSDHIWKVVQ